MRRPGIVLLPLALLAQAALGFTISYADQAPTGARVLVAHDVAANVGTHPWTHGSGTAVDVGQTFRLQAPAALEAVTVKVRSLAKTAREVIGLRIGTYSNVADFTMNELLRVETGQLPEDFPTDQVVFLTFALQSPLTLPADQQLGFVFYFAGGGGVNDARFEVHHLGGDVLADGLAIADFGSFTEPREADIAYFLHGTTGDPADPPQDPPDPPPFPAATATYILPSSARTPGTNAFWKTDLHVMNTGAEPAYVTFRFLGHEGDIESRPERTWVFPPRATVSWSDVLSSLFDLELDWGPIQILSSTATLKVQGQTWTSAASGGTCGQSLPAFGPEEAIGSVPKVLVGVRQDSLFRTNIVLANLKDSIAGFTLQVLRPDGSTSVLHSAEVDPLGFVQFNLAADLGVADLSAGSVLVTCTTPDGEIVAYASVIDGVSADPRTILAR